MIIKPEDKEIFDQQVNFAVNKYSTNRPSSIVRLEAIDLANDAYKKFDPSKSNLKTHLSGALKKLMRESYKASNPLKTTETRNIARQRVRMFRDDFIDSNGIDPSSHDVARALNVSHREADRMLAEARNIRVESNYLGGKTTPALITERELIGSLAPKHREVATDFFIRKIPIEQYAKKNNTSVGAATRKKSRLQKKLNNMYVKSSLEETYV